MRELENEIRVYRIKSDILLRKYNDLRRKIKAMEGGEQMTSTELRKLLKEAFDCGVLYGAESVRYGVDAVAYSWKNWIKKHDMASYVAEHKDDAAEGKNQTSAMQISFNPFDMGTPDDKARKVCEEATEFYAEHFMVSNLGLFGSDQTRFLRYEIGDVLTAMLNYCTSLGIDPQLCIDMVEEKNRNRGRYGK